ncbi:MAG: YARHG domain-containing protein [Clostridia bacterium]|nr:YARHG domain-containing protein [Clostridia bacterium]
MKKFGKGKMRGLAALLLAAVMGLSLMIPALAGADELYIIRDSDKRELTYDELWEYQYDTLLYAFNEIFARHGYKFETGSRCYNWFTQMPWYTPNESESATNHHETYAQCSKIENKNVDLIKKVRADMRNQKTTNPKGKGMPVPPAQNIDKPRGFSFVKLDANQKLAVFSAPSSAAYRANNGKAAVSTNGAVYAMGWDNGWMLMLYEADAAGQYRIGYVDGAKIKGTMPQLPRLTWDENSCEVLNTVQMTDDPALTGKTLVTLQAGTQVKFLTTMYNSTGWDYVETTIDGKTARGFIPAGNLSITGADATETAKDNG